MTTAWLLIVPMPLELMLPLMTLSQPTPRSRLQGDSAGVVCACAAGANPIHAATEVSTTKDFQVLGVIGHSFTPGNEQHPDRAPAPPEAMQSRRIARKRFRDRRFAACAYGMP